MKLRNIRIVGGAAVAAAAVGLASQAVAANAAAGKALAQQWCAQCHVVGPNEADYIEGTPTGPDFMKMAVQTAPKLKARLSSNHLTMPRFPDLNDQRIDDLVAYINSVRR